jgi:hypothetical protein
MKSTGRLIIIVFMFVALAAGAHAQSPREQLQQMVEQLQKTPTDNALREKIIKLGLEINPTPAVPDEALRREGRGNVAFKNAKNVEDYIAASREFEAASLAAPWIAGYYSDLCTVYEKGGALREAADSCRLYSMTLTDEKDIRGAKLRTAGIEYEAEKYSKYALQKLNRSKKPFSDVPGLPSGKLYFCNNNNYQSGKAVFRLGNDLLAPYGRLETWLVQNGSQASAVVVFWVSTESFSELMRAGVVIKNPLVREFPGTAESNSKLPTFSTDSPDAPVIQFMGDGSLAVTMVYASGLGRPPSISSACEPLH